MIRSMLQTISLLLPVMIPSWRFFDVIAPSPRIEIRFLQNIDDEAQNWHEFCPRPAHVPISAMLKRIFWNPHWNESLFFVSCAERLMQNPAEKDCAAIAQRIRGHVGTHGFSGLQFRLLFISRAGDTLHRHVTFVSPVYHL